MGNNKEKYFDQEKTIYRVLVIAGIICVCFLINKIANSLNDEQSFRSVSHKPFKTVSDKEDALNSAYSIIENVSSENDNLDPTNLNLAKVYKFVEDDEDRNYYATNAPIPVISDEDKVAETTELKSSAFQIYEKMQNRYKTYYQSLNNMCDAKPVNIVRQYHYDGYSIIGKYNPEDPTHKIGKRHTWFITNFQNVNIDYRDGDGNLLEDDNNIKDIMSMASILIIETHMIQRHF